MTTEQLLNKQYQILKVLGTDPIGSTYLVKDLANTDAQSQQLWLIQELALLEENEELTRFSLRLFQHKVDNLKEIIGDHPQIAKIHCHFSQNRKFYVVEQLVRGQTLATELTQLQPQSVAQVLHLLREVLGILEFTYDRGLISCCLQPNELVRQLSDGRIIWTGLGFLKYLSKQLYRSTFSWQNSPPLSANISLYHAPEYHHRILYANTDLYTLGIMAIQALTGQPLIELFQQPLDSVAQLKPDWKQRLDTPAALTSILENMVTPNPRDRYALPSEVLRAIATDALLINA